MDKPNFPIGRTQQIINAPPLVLVSIGVLLLIHLAVTLVDPDWSLWIIYAFAFIPARFSPESGMPMIPIPGSQWWTFVSYAFLHASWMHVIVNCFWLLIFGTAVARVARTLCYLAVAAAGAIGGAAASLALHWGEVYPMVGASGAISGLLAASVPIIYGGNTPLRHLTFSELLRHRSALTFMGIWLAITMVTGATGMSGGALGGMTIAWEAHLGGFAAGLAVFYALDLRRDRLTA